MKKYKILTKIGNTIIAKTNVPMNRSGEAVKQLLIDAGWDGKESEDGTRITCIVRGCNWFGIQKNDKYPHHEHSHSIDDPEDLKCKACKANRNYKGKAWTND